MAQHTTKKHFKNNTLEEKHHLHHTTQKQIRLDLSVTTSKEINGIGMGVLSDGTAYLTARGLAKLCGVEHTTILDIGNTWPESLQSPKVTKIKEILYKHDSPVQDSAYLEVVEKNVLTHAYPDYVCIAILEYYAFEAGIHIKKIALNNFRTLAGNALKNYIYSKVGYSPIKNSKWQPLFDRLSTAYDSAPAGYFTIFKETADLAVLLGENGLHVNQGFVHDISVGMNWSNYWTKNNLSKRFGERVRYTHEYPESYSQCLSNPQKPWAYPEDSLPEFRRWLRNEYINGKKLEKYLSDKGFNPNLVRNAVLACETKFKLLKH